MGIVFSDDFESGDFSAWDVVAAYGGSTFEVNASAAHHGEWGARGDSTGDICLARKDLAADLDVHWTRFNATVIEAQGDVDDFGNLFFAFNATPVASLQIAVWVTASGLELRMRPYCDDGSQAWMTACPIETGVPFCVETFVQRASGAGVSDGEARFYVDGRLIDTQTGLLNYTRGPMRHPEVYIQRVSGSSLDLLRAAVDDVAVGTERIGPLRGVRVYHNNGAGPVDFSAPAELRSEYVDAWTSGALSFPATWRFVLRSFNEHGEEKNIEPAAELTLLSTGEEAPARPNPPLDLRARAVADGYVQVTWRYDADDEQAACTHFHVYGDGGVGEVDYASPLGSVELERPSTTHTFLAGPLSQGMTYRFAVRAATGDDVEDTGTDWVSAAADALAPAQPASLSAAVVR